MQLHAIAEASGYLGSLLGVAMVVPQIVRTYRNRTLPGVSASSWALTAISCLTWLMYGVRSAELPQIPGNVLLITGAVVVVLAVPSAKPVAFRSVTLGAGAAAVVTLAYLLPPAAIGFVGFGIGLVSGLPQLFVSLTRREGDSAVSLLTWTLRVASQCCWLFYAVAIGDLVVTISATFLAISAALVVAAELVRGRATAAPAPSPVLASAP